MSGPLTIPKTTPGDHGKHGNHGKARIPPHRIQLITLNPGNVSQNLR
jgi:hypothetical protein